jgi:hypothetical protein
MKTPFPPAPALTRAQIDAIVSAGIVPPDAPPLEAGASTQRSRARLTRSAQAGVRTVASAAADYGCVDWYIYPDSHGESDSASEAA